MDYWAAFLADPKKQDVHSWLEGALTSASAGFLTYIKYLQPMEKKRAFSAVSKIIASTFKVFAERVSSAVGDNRSNSDPTIQLGPRHPRLISISIEGMGVIALTLVFFGHSVDGNESSLAVGGFATGRSVTIADEGTNA